MTQETKEKYLLEAVKIEFEAQFGKPLEDLVYLRFLKGQAKFLKEECKATKISRLPYIGGFKPIGYLAKKRNIKVLESSQLTYRKVKLKTVPLSEYSMKMFSLMKRFDDDTYNI